MSGKINLLRSAVYILCFLLSLGLVFKLWDCSKIDPSLIVALLSLGVSIFTISIAFYLFADWKKPYTQQAYREATLNVINRIDHINLEILEISHLREENRQPQTNEQEIEYLIRMRKIFNHQNNIVTRAAIDLEDKMSIFKIVRDDEKGNDLFTRYMQLHTKIMKTYDSINDRDLNTFYAEEELIWSEFSFFKGQNKNYLYDILKENTSK